MIYLAIPAVSIAVLLALAGKYWLMGRRAEALHYFDRCATVLIMLGVVWGLAWIGGVITSYIYGRGVDIFNIADVTNILSEAEEKFEEMWKTSVDWIMRIAQIRATTALFPLTHPISEVLGSALLWQNWAFSIATTSLLVMVILSRILAWIANWLLCIGVTLTATDTLRRLGAGLLAFYIATSIGVPVIANEAYRMYSGIPLPSITGGGSSISSSTVGDWRLNLTSPDTITIEITSYNCTTVKVLGTVDKVNLRVEPSEVEGVLLDIYPSEGNSPFNATLAVTASYRAYPGEYNATIVAEGDSVRVEKTITIIVKAPGEGGNKGRGINLNLNIADIAAEVAWKLMNVVLVISLGMALISAITVGLTIILGGIGAISIRPYL